MINYNKVIETLISQKAYKATQFVSPTFIVRAVRTRYKDRKSGKRSFNRGNIEVILTVGKPNYIEREFIKACKKAGEPFPIKKIQVKI